MRAVNRRSFVKLSGATVAGAVGVAGCLGDDDGTTFDVAYVSPISNITSLLEVPEIRDQLPNIGDSYDLEAHQVASTPSAMNEMAAGDFDASLITTPAFGSVVAEETVPGNITAIAMDFHEAYPDHGGMTVFSAPDSDITEVEDLEGGTVALSALGAIFEVIYRQAFLEVGIDPQDGVEYTEIGHAAKAEAVRDGRVDAAIFAPNFQVGPRADDFNLVFQAHDFFDPFPAAYMVARNDVLDDHGEEFEAFGEDYSEMIDYINNNRDETIDAGADHFDIDADDVDEWFLTDIDYFRGDAVIDEDALQGIHDLAHEIGFLDQQVDLSDHVTDEYVT